MAPVPGAQVGWGGGWGVVRNSPGGAWSSRAEPLPAGIGKWGPGIWDLVLSLCRPGARPIGGCSNANGKADEIPGMAFWQRWPNLAAGQTRGRETEAFRCLRGSGFGEEPAPSAALSSPRVSRAPLCLAPGDREAGRGFLIFKFVTEP